MWSFASTPHWLKTTQMAGLSLKSWMAGRCHLGGHWRRGSRSENVPLAYATANTMLVFQNRYFSILLSPNSPSSSAILPFLWGRRKTNVSLGKWGVTRGCPDHVGGGEYHVSRRDSMEGREMEGHTSGRFFQAFE